MKFPTWFRIKRFIKSIPVRFKPYANPLAMEEQVARLYERENQEYIKQQAEEILK